MSSSPLGMTTSAVEVTNISSHGVWLLAHGKELFMAYDDFPWFRDVPVGKILNVEEPSPNHYYWPDLDVDLTLEMIENPERFPLKSSSLDWARRKEIDQNIKRRYSLQITYISRRRCRVATIKGADPFFSRVR